MAIAKYQNIDWASITSVDNIARSSIASIGDIPVGGGGGGDISFNDITVTTTSQAISPTVAFNMTLPATAGAGDWVLAIYTIDDPTSGITTNPPGWTLINTTTWGSGTSDAHIKLWYRLFDGSEGSSVPIYSTISTTRGFATWTMVVSNIDTTSPISAVGAPVISSGLTIVAPAVGVPDDGTFICVGSFDGSDGEPFTLTNSSFTLTDGGEEDSNPGTTAGVASVWKYATITGGSNTDTTSITAQSSNGQVAGQFALKKA